MSQVGCSKTWFSGNCGKGTTLGLSWKLFLGDNYTIWWNWWFIKALINLGGTGRRGGCNGCEETFNLWLLLKSIAIYDNMEFINSIFWPWRPPLISVLTFTSSMLNLTRPVLAVPPLLFVPLVSSPPRGFLKYDFNYDATCCIVAVKATGLDWVGEESRLAAYSLCRSSALLLLGCC